jgi:hypothetical protein
MTAVIEWRTGEVSRRVRCIDGDMLFLEGLEDDGRDDCRGGCVGGG